MLLALLILVAGLLGGADGGPPGRPPIGGGADADGNDAVDPMAGEVTVDGGPDGGPEGGPLAGVIARDGGPD